MRRFTVVSAILYLMGLAIARYSPASLFAALEGIGFLALLASLFYYSYRFLRWLTNRLLYKVRNKIIISYAFIGIIPLAILAFISWFSIKLIFGQLGALYLESEIQSIVETLHHTNEEILLAYYRQRASLQDDSKLLISHAAEGYGKLPAALKKASLTVFSLSPSGETFQVPASFSPTPPGAGATSSGLPVWARQGFQGLAVEGNKLFFGSVSPVDDPIARYWLCLQLPFDEDIVAYIRQRTAIQTSPPTPLEDSMNLPTNFSNSGVTAPDSGPVTWLSDFLSANRDFLSIRWAHPLTPVEWMSGQTPKRSAYGVALAVPLGSIYDYYFNKTPESGRVVLYVVGILAVVFVLVEGISFWIAVAIARSITRSIHDIYTAAGNIREGNFQFRIPSQNRDQLDAMATSFNNMAESIVRLMQQVSENERLEKEIEIAREVQAQLFPRQIPRLERIDLTGACFPARRVSGDSYDFIPHDSQCLDIIISDISGKGISAALLMASLQSCVRTHMYRFSHPEEAGQVVQAVCEINRHLYHHTSPDKFATLFLGRLNHERLTLTYCNAGHNPPCLFSRGEVKRLTQGGMVVGIFEDCEFVEETVELRPEDLVVLYTDGIVEAEDPQEEPFGEQRLIDLISSNLFLTPDDLQALVFDQLSRWIGGREQSDDMTIVILKVR